MTGNDQPSRPMAKGRLALAVVGALLVAALVVFGAILPAEFHRDPTGLGKLTGLSRLWAPKETEVAATVSQAAARDYPTPFRSDVIEIPLGAGQTYGDNELEYKVRMRKGGSYVYSWSVASVADPEFFYYDFHGHTVEAADKMTVSTYKQATGDHANGALVAPFDGVHGWFFQNQDEKPVVVTLKIAGFYELIPPGQVGNEAGIVAGLPAARSRTIAPPQ